MERLDLLKERPDLYRPPSNRTVLVEVPEIRFLMIDGRGDPNTSPDFQDAVGALYSVSYTMKFKIKAQGGVDFKMMPLEGLWWTDDPDDLLFERKDEFSWTAMIAQPSIVTEQHVEEAVAEVSRKKANPALGKVRFEAFTEGLSAQILHVGPYSAERPTIEKLNAFIAQQGYRLAGKHHEIYLGDPQRTAPERLRTVIRHPVAAGK